ncbi:hypothetical protein GDO81_002579 [Engystomops pustulosus]|uniref:Uncharacterized protein n=1 Tax=Engystomops pustulosus TaxID=76066 RepID=A0AAV7DQ44_ENGPU|nr:hypothetical protein GDO81_002579 [Engystomops pustulosus]
MCWKQEKWVMPLRRVTIIVKNWLSISERSSGKQRLVKICAVLGHDQRNDDLARDTGGDLSRTRIFV